MTSVLSHWLSGKALFFRYISAIPPGWLGGQITPLQCTLLSSLNNQNIRAYYEARTHNQLFFLKPTLIFQHYLPLITPSHINLDRLYLINTPTYTYTACISFIPHIYLHSLLLIDTPAITTQSTSSLCPGHIYLHSVHLIYPPTYTYTACISFTYTACISLIPPHIPTQLPSHLSPHIFLQSLHLIYPSHITTLFASHLSPRI